MRHVYHASWVALTVVWGFGCVPPPRTSSPPSRAAPTAVATAASPQPLTPAALPAPPGWCPDGRPFQAGGRWYCILDEELPWYTARKRCELTGGHLATFSSSEEEKNLERALLSPETLTHDVWIGLTSLVEGQWRWLDGTQVGFAQWAPGEPNNYGNNEHCAAVYWGSNRWNDFPCESHMPFFCSLPPASSSQGGFQPFRCAGRQMTLAGKAYCYHDRPGTWGAAVATCGMNGGQLMMPRTKEEMDALREIFGGQLRSARAWIGMTDEGHEGSWTWVTGEPVKHTHWRPGEPNNSGQEDCAEWYVDGQGWNDVPCSISMPSLCERPGP